MLEGEAAACAHYERALELMPQLHGARNNLIRGLMKRGSTRDLENALEHARLAVRMQPHVAEMQYQLGVVLLTPTLTLGLDPILQLGVVLMRQSLSCAPSHGMPVSRTPPAHARC